MPGAICILFYEPDFVENRTAAITKKSLLSVLETRMFSSWVCWGGAPWQPWERVLKHASSVCHQKPRSTCGLVGSWRRAGTQQHKLHFTKAALALGLSLCPQDDQEPMVELRILGDCGKDLANSVSVEGKEQSIFCRMYNIKSCTVLHTAILQI